MKVVRLAFLLALLARLSTAMAHAQTSHLVVDHATGHILNAANEQAPRHVASLVKIATALTLLEWLGETGVDPEDRLVRVPAEALRGGANPLGLRTGDELSYETGLFAAMMASDNTSAHAMAEAAGREMVPGTPAGGGVAVFVARMNALAARLGMAATRFVNPHGLDEGSEFGVSTAADLARLALAALDRPGFGRYAAERERTVAFRRGGSEIAVKLANSNELVGSRGIDGLKTGTTRRAGPCLIATATRQLEVGGRTEERRLVAVVLNSEDRFRETVLLLDRAWPACAAWLAAGGKIDPKQSLRAGAK